MDLWIPIIVALITGLSSAPLTLWFTRQGRHMSIVTAQAQTIETYWQRITEQERERGRLETKILQYEERIARLEAHVGRLMLRIEEYERGGRP